MATATRDPDSPAPLVLDGDALDPIGGGGALVGYARVSTTDQLLDRQLLALRAAGCQKVFADKKSGKNAEREKLQRCLEYLRPGDTLVVPALDRLSRSMQDLFVIVAELRRRGIGFQSLHEASTPPPPADAWSSTFSPRSRSSSAS